MRRIGDESSISKGQNNTKKSTSQIQTPNAGSSSFVLNPDSTTSHAIKSTPMKRRRDEKNKKKKRISIIKVSIYSISGMLLLVAIAVCVSAVSNHAGRIKALLGSGGGASPSSATPSSTLSLFYEPETVVQDRVVDPRELARMRTLYNDARGDSMIEDLTSASSASFIQIADAEQQRSPIVPIAVGYSLESQVLHYNHPSYFKRVYEIVGIEEGGLGYEVKVSFLGSPPTNFDLKLFSLPYDAFDDDRHQTSAGSAIGNEAKGEDSGGICPCGRLACDAAITGASSPNEKEEDVAPRHAIPNTRRQLADIEKVMFKSADIGTSQRLVQMMKRARNEGESEGRRGNKSTRQCCRPCDFLSIVADKGDRRPLTIPTPHQNPPPDGVRFHPAIVTIDKSVAIPYESEHVVRYFERHGDAEKAMGVRFGLGRSAAANIGSETESEDSAAARPNRLFVVVSAYPKGVSKVTRKNRNLKRKGRTEQAQAYSEIETEEEKDAFAASVRFNINVERMYFGQFPVAILFSVVTLWPILTIVWVSVIPRIVDAVQTQEDDECVQ